MGKMTLDEIRAAARELSEEEQEILYLDLAFKMKDEDSEIMKSHKSLLEKRWEDFSSGKTNPVPLDRALLDIDKVSDA